MRSNCKIAMTLLGAVMALGGRSAVATDDHLLLCEGVVTPTEGEYIEIVNKTGSAVSLDDYYLSDDEDYALLPGQFGNGPAPAIGTSDFIARFPAGASIGVDEVIVVAFDGAGFLATYGIAADFEIADTDATPNMLEAYAGSIGASAGLTNGGEAMILFTWDGASDLVDDVDLMNIGVPSAANTVGNKTGVMVDGPDGDTTASTYAADAGMGSQAASPGFGFSTKRSSPEAGQESTGGGNGLTGDDETSENIAVTWDAAFTAPDPGICEFTGGPVTGACCDTVLFICTDDVEEGDCIGANEEFSPNLTCDLVLCDAVGACCLNGACYDNVAEGDCTDAGGSFSVSTTCDAVTCAAPTDVVINEIRIDQSGDPDIDEFFELQGTASASLSDLTYIVIGDDLTAFDGYIESVTSLAGQSLDGNGYFVAAEDTFTLGVANLVLDSVANELNFENSDNVTHLIVRNFTGNLGDDLDTDDDGVLDSTPWSEIVDCVSLIETPGAEDLTYCLGNVGPDGSFVPGSAFRCGDGGDWQVGDFFPGGSDTPGAANACGACCETGTCDDNRAETDCVNAGGTYQGTGTDCGTVSCSVGACCVAGTCSDGLDESGCIDLGGEFQGSGSNCGSVTCDPVASIVISEIMYNPNSSEGIPNLVEWVEIYNTGVDPVDVSGWFLQDEDGMTAGFPGGTEIDGGEAIVIIPSDQTVTGFQDAWGSGYQIIPVDGWGVPGLSSLSNSPSPDGEILSVRTSTGVAVDVVNFDDEGDWPVDFPDGPSIASLCSALDPVSNDSGLNWYSSQLGLNGAINNVMTGAFGGVDTGSPGVVVCPEETPGACCRPDESCFETSEAFCDDSGFTFFGEGVACGDITCPAIGDTGACCTEGVCEDGVSQKVCENAGGSLFVDTLCADLNPGDCPEATDLIISEFVEGTIDNNDGFGPSNQPRFIEITNTGCTPANLAAYSVGNFNNGGTTLGGGSATQLSGTLNPGESFIFSYSVEPPLLPGVIDVFFNVYGFQPGGFAGGGFINGNDNVALFRGLATGTGADATMIDVYGNIAEVEDAADFSPDWCFVDTVAFRNPNVVTPNGGVFNIAEWNILPDATLLGVDDTESTTLLQNLTNPGTHTFNDPCTGGAIAAPSADDRFNVNGDVVACVADGDCAGQAVCRDGSCYVPSQKFLSIQPNAANTGSWTYRVSLDTGVAGTVVLGFAGAPVTKTAAGPGPGAYVYVDTVDVGSADYRDWVAEANTNGNGYLELYGCEVAPLNSYLVQAIAQGDDTSNEANYSTALALPTSKFGDATGGGAVNTPPDGSSNLIDVFAAVLSFQNNQGGPKYWFDVEPATTPNGAWSLADVFIFVQGFQTLPYPGTNPTACP